MIFIRRNASGRMSPSFFFFKWHLRPTTFLAAPLSINSISPLQNFGITYSIVLSWNSVAGPGLPQPRSCQPPGSRRVRFLCRYFVTCARHCKNVKVEVLIKISNQFHFLHSKFESQRQGSLYSSVYTEERRVPILKKTKHFEVQKLPSSHFGRTEIQFNWSLCPAKSFKFFQGRS